MPGGPKSRIPRQGVRFPATEPSVKASPALHKLDLHRDLGPAGTHIPSALGHLPARTPPPQLPPLAVGHEAPLHGRAAVLELPVTLTSEQVWELDGQDHGFLQGLLGSLQPSHVAPPHIGLLHHDGTCGAERRAGAHSSGPPNPHPATPTPRHKAVLAANPSSAPTAPFSVTPPSRRAPLCPPQPLTHQLLLQFLLLRVLTLAVTVAPGERAEDRDAVTAAVPGPHREGGSPTHPLVSFCASLTGLLPCFSLLRRYSFSFSARSRYCTHLARMLSLAFSLCASSAGEPRPSPSAPQPRAPRAPPLTFDGVQEVLHGVLVQPQRLLVVLGLVLLRSAVLRRD